MGSAIVTSVDALISERHSVGIELIILMRKNLCSGLISDNFFPYLIFPNSKNICYFFHLFHTRLHENEK